MYKMNPIKPRRVISNLYKEPEAATGGISQKKLLIKILQYSQENSCVGLDSLCWSTCVTDPKGLQLYKKETPTQLFPCKYCKIFKISFFFKERLVPAS